ncbi:MAG: SusC/RagA family TonB-linked outer membrane protein [Gemmatimonadales bacterium]|nr:SusC/RagA family TonB-linked outer membrane protein [Gemmatimonadales bacterium]
MRLRKLLGTAVALLALTAGRLVAQDVSGVVLDSRSGRALEGARVVAEGAGKEMRTDGRGRFTLTGLSGATVNLRVTMIGYRPQTVAARVGDRDVRILISEQAVNLGELVVTGTPEAAERRTLGNSTATVHAADQQAFAPAPDISNLINSRAPGVVVIPGTGQVGSGPQVRIRGVNSFSLNGNPLIYVDGARVNNDVAQGISVQGFGSGIASRLNDIDPDQIESIEIIKGPAAATLYGTEATNGVIQIITKKGKAGQKPTIAVSMRQGTNWFMNPEGRIVQPVNLVNTTTGAACAAVSATCELRSWNPVAQEDSLFAAGVTDRPLFKNGWLMGYGVTLSGGTDAIRYHVGSSFDADNGIEPTNDLRRLTTNANLNISGGEKFDVNMSLGIVKNKTNQAFEAGAGGIWFSTIFGDPALVATPRRGFNGAPPEYQWGSRQAVMSINRYTASVTVNHRPFSWLSQKLTVGLDQTDQAAEQLNRYLPPEWVQFNPGGALGLKFKGRRTVNYSTFDYAANARFTLSEAIKSTTSLGAQYYRRRTDDIQAQKEQFVAPGLETVQSAAANPFAFEDYFENATLGVYGQQQFGWKDKFYLTAAVRVDNNSAFGDNFDLIAYPKVSGSYIAKEGGEGFLNTLKFRAAYGQAGQQPVAFAALRSWRAVTGGDGAGAPIPEFVGNPDLKPERASEIEIGADGGMLNDRLGFAVTGFYKKTKDAILLQNLAPSLGFAGTQFVNVGAIRNRGIELEVYGRPIETRSFNLDLRFSLANIKNKVLDLGTNPDGTPRLTLGGGQATVGNPVNAYYARRVVAATLNGTGPTATVSGVLCDDGVGGPGVACASAPLVLVGQYDPTTEGSFSATATIKGRIRLYGLVDFKTGNRHTDNNRRALCQVFLRCIENFQPENYDPKLIAEIKSAGTVTSFVASKADFAKLRELSLAYQLPRRVARWFAATDGSVALSARNLHTWTGYSGLDPEAFFVTQQFQRLEQDQTPQLASLNFSINLTF